MSEVVVVVHPDAQLLAQAVAARLVTRLIDAQARRGRADVVLTGGRVAAAVYRAVRDLPARDAVDWARVDFWWGDERFLPAGHPDRNETQARDALLDHLPVPAARIHPMPPSDGPDGADPEAAADRYADELASAAGTGGVPLPHFDVLMLGVGEDGHVASVFPRHPVLDEIRPVSAVRGSPKPPPVRTTLTLSTINTADELWLVASGADKATAIGAALRAPGLPAGEAERNPRSSSPTRPGASGLPAARVHGVTRTLWLLDRAAAVETTPAVDGLRQPTQR